MNESELLSYIPAKLNADLRQNAIVALLTERPTSAADAERIVRRCVNRERWTKRQDRKGLASIPDYAEPVAVQSNVNPTGPVYEAVCTLPDHLRQVLILRYVEQLTAAEVAERMGVSRVTIHAWTQQAKQATRALHAEVPQLLTL